MFPDQQLRVSVAQLGSRMHYAVPALLHEGHVLEHFFTDTYVGEGSWLSMVVKAMKPCLGSRAPAAVQRLVGRAESRLPGELVSAFNLFGVLNVLNVSRATSYAARQRANILGNKLFCNLVAARGLGNSNVVYAFNTAALEVFRHARRRSILPVLEQMLLPARFTDELLRHENELWAGWEEKHPEGGHALGELADREEQEIRLAELIVSPSEFVADGLERMGVPRARISLVPYGVAIDRFVPAAHRWAAVRARPLRVLFLGAVGLRKGVQYLYRCLERFGTHQVEAKAVGPILLRDPYRRQLAGRMELTGGVPRTRVRDYLDWADVFVFPTICEGSATVIYEALACGVPVITTPNAGSVVRDNVDGFVVPIRNVDALTESLERLVQNRALLPEMSIRARERATEHSWARYGERLIAALGGLVVRPN